MSEPCPSCGYIHASTDARAIGRFGTAPTRYVAATAGTPPRETRAEAEADECASRIRPKPQTSGADAGVAAGDDRGAVRGPARPDVPTAPEHLPFPAVEFETAARAKAWHDFLAQLRRSRWSGTSTATSVAAASLSLHGSPVAETTSTDSEPPHERHERPRPHRRRALRARLHPRHRARAQGAQVKRFNPALLAARAELIDSREELADVGIAGWVEAVSAT